MCKYYQKDFQKIVSEQMEPLYRDPCHVDLSFEHCYTFFHNNHDKEAQRNSMTAHLYAYLANWGMLRNSFLAKRDYLLSRPVIDILCKPEYTELLSIDPFSNNNDAQIDLILSVKNEICDYYKSVSNRPASDTLVTKILLATFGCTPAYDIHVKKALKGYDIRQTFNKESLQEVFAFAKDNRDAILAQSDIIKSKRGMEYPVMKIVDSYLWKIGKDQNELDEAQKAAN